MAPTTFSFFCSTAAPRIGPVLFNLATLSITFCRMALSSVFPGFSDTAFTAGVMAATSDGSWPGRIFQAGNGFVTGKISGDTADEKVSSRAVESVFRRDARIRATQDGGIGILAANQRFALVSEVVAARNPVDIAFISLLQLFQRRVRRHHVPGLGR